MKNSYLAVVLNSYHLKIFKNKISLIKGVEMRIFWKISSVILFMALLIIIFFSSYIYNNIKNDIIDEFNSSSTKQINQLDKFIDFFLNELKNDIEMACKDSIMKKIDQSINTMLDDSLPASSIPEYNSEIDKEILEIFKNYHDSHPSVTMISLGTEYGGYIEYPIYALGRNYDPRIRPWYLRGVENAGKVVITSPYLTLFSKLPQISAVLTTSDNSGNVSGVLSIDVTLDVITQLVEQNLTYKKGELLVIDKNGKIIASSVDKKRLFKNISTVNTLFSEYKQFGEYETIESDNHTYHLISKKSDKTDFYYMIISSNSEILEDLNKRTTHVVRLAFLVLVPLFILVFLLCRNLSRPLEKLSGYMLNFASGDLNIRSDVKGSKEINLINKNFNLMADMLQKNIIEINQYNEELQCLNEELEKNNVELNNSYEKINEHTYEMEELISITSRICISAFNRDHSFLKDLLETLMSFIKKVDYGSISIIEGEEWKFIWSVGHDIDGLKELKLQKEYLIFKENGTQIVDTMEFNSKNIPNEIFDKLCKYSRPIKSSIVSNLSFNNKLIGSISLDIAKDSSKEFTDNELRMVNAFSNIASAFLTMQNYMKAHGKFQSDLLTALIGLLEIHDPYTKGHSLNVANYSSLIAKEMNLEQNLISRIYWAGMVHDIGKVLIPSLILTKPSQLTDEEYDMIKKHPEWGARVLKSFDALKDISLYIRHHHERWNGTGYPDELSGTEIPLASRIICIADTFDAMTSDRPYRAKLNKEEAYNEILKNSGTQFDTNIVKAFQRVFKKLNDENSFVFNHMDGGEE